MNLQLTLDKVAIGTSLLCAIHCLALPVAMILGSSVVPFGLNDEAYHKWLLIAIVPTSLVALTMGCRKHKRHRVYIFGGIGLLLLGFAGFLGHDYLGEIGEKVLTVMGGMVVAFGHVSNYQLCQKLECDCSSSEEEVPKENEVPDQWTLS